MPGWLNPRTPHPCRHPPKKITHFEVSPTARSQGASRLGPQRFWGARGLGHQLGVGLQLGGELLDPHTAVGVAAALRVLAVSAKDTCPNTNALVALACAHPAKFEKAVQRALGHSPELPPRLAEMMELPEKHNGLPNDLAKLENFIQDRVRGQGAAA